MLDGRNSRGQLYDMIFGRTNREAQSVLGGRLRRRASGCAESGWMAGCGQAPGRGTRNGGRNAFTLGAAGPLRSGPAGYVARKGMIYFAWIFCQVSRRVTVRLKTGLPGAECTGSTLK